MNHPVSDTIQPAAVVFLGMRKAAPHGEIARVLLAFLATAGLFYVNIMPALVEGLIEGAGFSNRQAGMVGSSNVYGAALGALVAVFLVKRINWRAASYALLVGLISMDLLSLLVQHFLPLLLMRFAHGFVGGMLVGIGFSIIARTTHPDRTFGYLLVVQFGLGGLGLMVLPPLVPVLGTGVLFGSLILFSLTTLLMVPFLSEYPVEAVSRPAIADAPDIQRGPLALSLLATFLFQAGNMGVYAYVIGLGQAAGLSMEFISPTLAAAAWIGIIGSGLVIILPTRLGRTAPLGAAILLTAVATWALNYSDVSLVFVVANCAVGITWAFGIPYLLGMCAQFDKAGQMAALGGFASKMGLASGPMIAALVVGADNYSLVVNLGAAALVICLLAALVPMRLLDRSRA